MTIEDKLSANCSREGKCLVWLRATNSDGYGMVRYQGKMWKVHVLRWYLEYGPIPAGKGVLHSCDLRHCFELAHLFLGTQGDNVRDAARKGRHGQSLSPEDYNKVKELIAQGLSNAEIGKIVGRHKSTIWYIRMGKGLRQ